MYIILDSHYRYHSYLHHFLVQSFSNSLFFSFGLWEFTLFTCIWICVCESMFFWVQTNNYLSHENENGEGWAQMSMLPDILIFAIAIDEVTEMPLGQKGIMGKEERKRVQEKQLKYDALCIVYIYDRNLHISTTFIAAIYYTSLLHYYSYYHHVYFSACCFVIDFHMRAPSPILSLSLSISHISLCLSALIHLSI